jgi:hypothetical protein
VLRSMSEEVDGIIGFLVDIVKIAFPFQYRVLPDR